MKKILKTIGAIAGVLLALNWARYALMDIHPMAFVVFSPVIATVIAKIISARHGDEGKMSRAYKKRSPKNKLAFHAFCILAAIIPLLIGLEEADGIGPAFPAALLEVGAYVYLAVLALAGVAWIVSEVVRRDFPWGLFRLIERLVFVFLICVGVYLVATIVGPYLVYIGMILIPAIMIRAVMLLWDLLWEAWLWLRYPDPEKRKAVKREIAQMEWRRMQRERQNQEKWDNARPKDFWGNPYTGRDQDGYVKQLRKTSDGTYVDKDGHEYTEVK